MARSFSGLNLSGPLASILSPPPLLLARQYDERDPQESTIGGRAARPWSKLLKPQEVSS